MRVTRNKHVVCTVGIGCVHGVTYLASSTFPAALAGAIRAGSWLPWSLLTSTGAVARQLDPSRAIVLLWCTAVWLAVYWFATGVLAAAYGYWRQRPHRRRHPELAVGIRRHLWHQVWRVERVASIAVPVAIFALAGSLSLAGMLRQHPDLHGTVTALSFGMAANIGGCADVSDGLARIRLSTGGTTYAAMDLATHLRVGQPVTLNWQLVACGEMGYEAIVAPRGGRADQHSPRAVP
ncbi:MAG TPA: hypothetical protein VF264_02470 [Rhodanobacteraceae bacterium]